MRGLAAFLIRLYPATWRARYGEEFEALVEDSSSGWPAVVDLLKGAIKMHFSLPTFPKLALMLSVTGLLIGLLVSALVRPTYVSEAEVRLGVGPDSTSPRYLVEYVTQLQQEVFSRTSLSAVIQDPHLNLYPEERAGMPLEDVIERMRKRDITIRVVGGPAFTVSFAYRDRVKARDTVQALINRFADANAEQRARSDQKRERSYDQIDRMEARIATVEKRLGIPPASPELLDQHPPVSEVEVIDPPSLPKLPTKPNREIFMAIGFGAGFVAASVIAIFRRRPPAVPFPAQTT